MSASWSYRLFGVRLRSDRRFGIPLWPEPEPAGSRAAAGLQLRRAPGGLPDPAGAEPVYTSPLRDSRGEPRSRLHRLGDDEILSFPDGTAFRLGERRIDYSSPAAAGERRLEIRFLGAVMAYWLERRGGVSLHASAVEVDGRAIAFAGPRGAGKTGLLGAFVAAGDGALTDDLLALEAGGPRPVAHPGYPCLRMAPALAAHFLGAAPAARLEAVLPPSAKRLVPLAGGFGRFAADDLPLAAIYLPERASGDARIAASPIGAAEAVARLAALSFSPYIVEAAGLSAARLARLARLAETVPIRRLDVPDDLRRLPEVRRALLADLVSGADRPPGGSR